MHLTASAPAERGASADEVPPVPGPRPDVGVLIVDDHRSFADLLAAAIDAEAGFHVVGTAHSTEAALRAVAARRPDMVVMDIELGGSDGLSAARMIRDLAPQVLTVVISAHTDPVWVARAARAGANGYAPKSGSLADLLGVLKHAKPGQFLAAPSLRQHRVVETPGPGAVLLTGREAQVLSLLADGAGPAEIARILGISLHTCRGHVKAIYGKLGARSQLEALAAARRRGLLSTGDEQSG